MKLHLETVAGQQLFTGYGESYVSINHIAYRANLILMAEQLIENWAVERFEALTVAHFEALAAFGPEIVLLGTGASLRFPHPQLFQVLAQRQIGLEVMDTPAVCRTYNILLAEGRKVIAAIFI